MKLILSILLLTISIVLPAKTPFTWQAEENGGILSVKVIIPANHYLYKDSTTVKAAGSGGRELKPSSLPSTAEHEDSVYGKVTIYPAPEAVWKFTAAEAEKPLNISISSQGCRDAAEGKPALCFRPENINLTVGTAAPLMSTPEVTSTVDTEEIFKGFKVIRSEGGYMNADKFLHFVKGDKQPKIFEGRSLLVIILLILLGGAGLNLTPCVLPMIPINLAIIGAGKGAENRMTGLLRGSAYGLGMALAYGALGVIAVLTGAQFGTLNSNPWFNFAIAAVFVFLALGMFGAINIDFSRFGSKINTRNMEHGRLAAVFLLGGVAALLAGACVAPVVLAVLVYSVKLYAAGHYQALLLPLLLGIGMALPWPFAGAGMAVLPRPGRWMTTVKYVFGAFIILFALYYAYIGWRNLPLASRATSSRNELAKLRERLNEARQTGKPVIIDFWSTWCKNCLEMDRTTFKDEKVIEVLKPFEVIKYQAEDFSAPETAALLDNFNAPGLPFIVILEPDRK